MSDNTQGVIRAIINDDEYEVEIDEGFYHPCSSIGNREGLA